MLDRAFSFFLGGWERTPKRAHPTGLSRRPVGIGIERTAGLVSRLLGETVIAFDLRFGNQSTDSTDTRKRGLLMAETKIEKLTSLEAASTAAADAAGADTVPIVIPSATADRELSDEDLDKVAGGAGEVRPQVRQILSSSPSY
jgi:hypothetical protein